MKSLVAYFSAGGVTAEVARVIAEAAGAELFAITPEPPYSEQDIRWTNPFARCNKEKFGRLAIRLAGNPENLDGYDMIFLGFPIWYFGAPKIISVFLEENDLTGKKVALFATSGGSDITKAAEELAARLEGKAEIVGAKRFAANDERELIACWAERLAN